MMSKERKIQKTYRLSQQTISQIESLSRKWGTSLTETLSLIVDRQFHGGGRSDAGPSVPDANVPDAESILAILNNDAMPYAQRVIMVRRMLDGLQGTDGCAWAS